jgi:hypothetical protein
MDQTFRMNIFKALRHLKENFVFWWHRNYSLIKLRYRTIIMNRC